MGLKQGGCPLITQDSHQGGEYVSTPKIKRGAPLPHLKRKKGDFPEIIAPLIQFRSG